MNMEKDTKNGEYEEKEMEIENLDEENSVEQGLEKEFPAGEFWQSVSASAKSELTLKVEKVREINTKFGTRVLLCGQGVCIFGTKMIFNALAKYGIRKYKDVIGKTLHLGSVKVIVRGQEKRTWELQGVE